MEGLGLDLKSLIFQTVNFAILAFLLGRFLYGPIIKVLDSRRKKIEESVKETEKIKQELAEVKKEQAKILAQARDEAKVLLAKEAERAKANYQEALTKAASDVNQTLIDGRQALERQRDEFHEKLKGEMSELVKDSLRKVLHEGLSEGEKEKLVTQALKKIS